MKNCNGCGDCDICHNTDCCEEWRECDWCGCTIDDVYYLIGDDEVCEHCIEQCKQYDC